LRSASREQLLSTPLPITDVLSRIVALASDATPVVVQAPPGAGKTTGVATALLESGITADGQILLVQPRRLAARSAARRIAGLVGSDVGSRVGYHVRFDRRCDRSTELVVMTTGILLRRLQSDPLLDSVTCVILDEFHERSLELDLSLGMLQRIRTTLRDDLRLIVMSATLAPQPIVDYFGDAQAVVSEGRSFPVDVRYARQASRERVEHQVAECLPQAIESSSGDILVFLPGVGEIKRTATTIAPIAKRAGIEIAELYGDLSPEQQDRVIAEQGVRRIVLSTNVAETSVTLPHVTAVIDSGSARVMTFDAHVGLPCLRRQPISQAAADQRAGRAGRTGPGVCYRLWPQAADRGRPESELPEIRRGDLCGAVLSLAGWGETDVMDFPWLTSPSRISVDAARTLLSQLGGIDANAKVTDLGRAMLNVALHPRLAKLMIVAARVGLIAPAGLVAAMLTERDPFRGGSPTNPIRGREKHPPSERFAATSELGGWAENDLLGRVEKLQRFAAGGSVDGLQPASADHVLRVARHLSRGLSTVSERIHDSEPPGVRLTQALLAAYPDRVARRRAPGSDRGVMFGGRGVRLDGGSQVRSSELFLCFDVDAGDQEARVRLAAGIEKSWLDPRLIETVAEAFFHPTLGAVVMRRRTFYGDLLLDEMPVECRADERTAKILAAEAKRHWQKAFPAKNRQVADFLFRLAFLTKHAEHLQLPMLDDVTLQQILEQLCLDRTTLAELFSAPWLDYLRSRYSYDQLIQIDREAPPRIPVPSGNSHAIDYGQVDAPTMSVKLQELFGMRQTPRLAGGRIPLRMQLLGPNGRPQQLTDDLASFWTTTYPQVRKDLRGRYPKHYWPEDPLTATATRNGLKPKN